MATEFFAFNLAVNKILFCLLSFISFINLYLPLESLEFVFFFSFGFFISGRLLFQACICLERYLAVVHPVVFLRYKPLRYRLACSGLVWMLTLGVCTTSMVLQKSVKVVFLFAAMIMLAVGVMLYCCLSVLVALKRPGPGEGERGREEAVT